LVIGNLKYCKSRKFITIKKSRAWQNQYYAHRYSHLSFIVFVFIIYFIQFVVFILLLFFFVVVVVIVVDVVIVVVVGNGRFKRSIYSNSNIWTTTPQPVNPPLPLPTYTSHTRTIRQRQGIEKRTKSVVVRVIYQEVCVRLRVMRWHTADEQFIFSVGKYVWSVGRSGGCKKKIRKKERNLILADRVRRRITGIYDNVTPTLPLYPPDRQSDSIKPPPYAVYRIRYIIIHRQIYTCIRFPSRVGGALFISPCYYGTRHWQ
jgi:hypothetical protein